MIKPLSPIEKKAVRQRLYRFIKWAWPLVDPAPFIPNWHIEVICAYLEAATRGELGKLLINIPPGHQKSLTVSVFWPVWAWLEHPEKRFMSTSYRGDLSLRDADRSRDLIRSPEFQAEFGDCFQLRKGQDVKSRYSNLSRGYRFSTSIAGIMGEGGDFVTLDDPHNVEQAESDQVREEVVRRIRLAVPTRVRSKDGCLVVMMQRLHSRDYAGAMAKESDVFHLCLPARYEPDHPFLCKGYKAADHDRLTKDLPGDMRTEAGELLFPGLFNEERLLEQEETLGSYGTAGQLQQRPVPREGGMFKRSWFDGKFIEASELPAGGKVVRGWDLAASTDATSAYTASVKLLRVGKSYYIWHAGRFRKGPSGVREEMLRLAQSDGIRVGVDFPQDPGQAGKAQAQDLKAYLDGFNVRSSPESGSKVLRAEAVSAQAEAGNVFLVRGPWNDALLDELCLFPGGDFADFTDALSRAYHSLKSPSGGDVAGGVELIEG